MKTTTLLLLLSASLLFARTAVAQAADTPADGVSQSLNLIDMGVNDYVKVQLPPLHTLMENARINSPAVNVYEANKEIEQRELKSVRRTWLSHIKLNAGYTYGSTDMSNLQYNQTGQAPVIQTVTGTEQSWWNLGANISLPLTEIFNRRNLVKQQKKKIESIQYEADRWYDEVCMKIIDAYTSATQYLALLQSVSGEMITARAQYEFSKTDFINGKINAQTLSRQKSIESSAIREYEQTRAQLNKALLQLEILSKTPIITPIEQFSAY